MRTTERKLPTALLPAKKITVQLDSHRRTRLESLCVAYQLTAADLLSGAIDALFHRLTADLAKREGELRAATAANQPGPQSDQTTTVAAEAVAAS